jgi:hypothetical protein
METSDKTETDSAQPNQIEYQQNTSCPNDNSKHIDYVIIYKSVDPDVSEDETSQKEEVRKAFFHGLEKEGIQIDYIVNSKEKEVHVYALLHAPLDVLLKQAERFKLQTRLNNVCNIWG